MASYIITAPDGKEYEIEGDGTPEEALAHFQQQWTEQHPPGAMQKTVDFLRDPTRDVPYIGEGTTFDDYTDAVASAGADVLSSLPDLGELGYRMAKSKITGEPLEQGPLFSDTIKREAGIDDPRESEGAQAVQNWLPWAVPSRRVAGTIANEANLLSRIGGLVRHGIGGATDKIVSDIAVQTAKDAGYDETGQLAAAVLGSGARPLMQRGAGAGARKLFARDDASQIFDAAERQGIQPTFGMLTGKTGQQLEKGLGALPLVGYGVDSARQNVLQQTEDALSRATGHPVIPGESDLAQGFIEAAQNRQTQRRADASAEQGAIERAIGPETPVDVSPVVSTIQNLAGPAPGTGSPGIGEPFKENMRRQLPNLERDVDAMNPGARQNTEVWRSEADRIRQENYDANVAHQNEVQRLNDEHQAAIAASQAPVRLSGRDATAYIESLAGTLTPKQLFDLNVKLKAGKGSITVGPNDPNWQSVAPAAPVKPTLPPRPVARPEPVIPPEPTTAGYGAIKDERSLLRERMEGTPTLTAGHAAPLYGSYSEAMRGAAGATPGVGVDRFDAAMQDYANLQNVEVPWLGAQGGFPRGGGGFEAVPSESAVGSRLRRAVGPNETFLHEAVDPAVGGIPDATREAVAGIIRGFGREGRVDPNIRPDRLATDLSRVNPTAAGMIPGGPEAVADLQTTGRAYGSPRDQASATKSSATGNLLAKLATPVTLPIMALSSGALESGPVIRSIAGRTNYSPLVEQMLIRAGLAGQGSQ